MLRVEKLTPKVLARVEPLLEKLDMVLDLPSRLSHPGRRPRRRVGPGLSDLTGTLRRPDSRSLFVPLFFFPSRPDPLALVRPGLRRRPKTPDTSRLRNANKTCFWTKNLIEFYES